MSKHELQQIILEAGYSELNALKMADAIYDAIEEQKYPQHLVTKEDLALLRAEMKADMSALKVDMVEQIRNGMTICTAILGLLIVCVKFLAP